MGRYFSLVSMLPALLLVLWVYSLLTSGAWSHPPQVGMAAHAFAKWSLGDAAWALVATLVLALFLHPLQFATTQVLEGYWGTTPAARAAMTYRVLSHRRRRSRMDNLEQFHQQSWQDAADRAVAQRHVEDVASGYLPADGPGPDTWDDATRARRRTALLDSDKGEHLVPDLVAEDAARRSWSRYPAGGRVMPTRLGNALRRFEDAAGAQYGLRAIPVAPHLALVAPQRHVAYLQDSRQQLDTTIRLCMVSLLATAVSIVVLLRDGVWLLVALVPYTLAYVAYRGAVASADEYGTAVATIVDLDRFLLYDKLRLDPPRDTTEERATNASLLRLLGGDATEALRYHREPSTQGRRRNSN